MQGNFTKQLRKDLTLTFLTGSALGLTVFAWIRSILYEIPFSIKEDGINMFRVILTGWILMIVLRLSIYVLFFITERLESISIPKLILRLNSRTVATILFFSLFFMSCKMNSTGISKELDTGLTTKYSGLKPERTRIVMNDEVLNHHDIPLGESFKIINEGVSGFEVRDGKVSVSCSLEITDAEGKVLLSAPDLFKGNNDFTKEKAEVLSCTVNTGEPMKWEENYQVRAVFIDNYGKGTIENKITIRAIDIP